MRLLILGTGNMAKNHAQHFAAIEGVTLVGAVDVDPIRVETFCTTHGIERGFASLEEALAWGDFDAVSNVTPDSVHYATTMAALVGGKHVFCEKPLSTEHSKALQMTEAAEAAGLVAMVNLSYRNSAELQKARQIVQSGQIGEVRHVEASYLQSWLVSKAWGNWRTESQWLWRLSKKHGSNGALGDIGIHILDFVIYGAAQPIVRASARLQTFHKAPGDQIGEYPLDANDGFVMSVEFANGALGVIHASRFATGYLNTLRMRIYGDKGGLELQYGTGEPMMRLCAGDDAETQVWRDVPVEPVPTNYQRFVDAVRLGCTQEPSFRHAAALQKILDLATVMEGDRTEHAI
jgi:predicted dehydrogenase